MAVDWSYFNKYKSIDEKYLPTMGEGETKTTQIVTAVAKLVYKWYNNGDVFDNTHYLSGWCNDLSSYANWLDQNTKASKTLHKIESCYTDDDYEDLLKELVDTLETEEYLAEMNKIEKIGTIYKCDGDFKFVEDSEDEDEW